MPEFTNLQVEIADGIAVASVNRPDKLNALNHETIGEIARLADEIAARAEIRGAVITGVGEKAFVAGADIGELARGDGSLGALGTARRGQAAFRALELCRKPIIAAVNGYALGGGCELALACHIRIASENAQFGLPEVKLGLIPGYGGTVRLPRLVGKGRALEIMLTGTPIKADEAYRIGLVNRVVPQPELLDVTRSILAAIIGNGPVAVGLAIESATRGLEMSTDDALALEANLFGLVAGTADMREGTAAFLEKRKPSFAGR